MDKLKLKGGNEIPKIGLGTWKVQGEDCITSVKNALDCGYLHIDTALRYGNHREIAQVIKDYDRTKLFITSKVWIEDLSYEGVKKQIEDILDELEIDYIDLCLVHWPNRNFQMEGIFKAFEEAVNDKKIISIGVSNFTINHIKDALEVSNVPISVNQIETHPYLYQEELIDFCKENGIVIEAYSPFGHGLLLKDEVISEIAKNKGKTSSQVILKWLSDKDIVALPKSISRKHLEENLDLDFELTDEETKKIDSLNRNERTCNPTSISDFDY